ncbi:START domain-containing protein [Salicola sp. Rm-C-2C1-2]|uniref:START domain-containing protein n=1 Tax=Salicola sp. Rm-C-2C1-2 TaxID=3141321 RepID=UPI0032E3B74A
MRYALTAVLILAMVLATTIVHAQVPTNDKNWEKAVDSDGIEIHTRNLKGSRIDAFRAEMVLDAPLEAVMAVMANPKSCTEWVHQCAHAKNLAGGTFRDRYTYSINDMPWPVSDRDYVLHIKAHTGESRDHIIIEMESVEGMVEKKDDYVRMPKSSTVYEFFRKDDSHTRIVWYQHAAPGGSLPNWLVNRLATDIPYESLQTLNNVVQKERYQGHKLVFDDEGRITGIVPGVNTGEEG